MNAASADAGQDRRDASDSMPVSTILDVMPECTARIGIRSSTINHVRVLFSVDSRGSPARFCTKMGLSDNGPHLIPI
jgi:hypothetical protein